MPTLHRTLAVVAVALTAITAACSTDTAGPTSPTTTTAAPSSPATSEPPATPTTVAAPPPSFTQQRLEQASPPTQAIIAATAGALGLQPDATACLAARLDADPALRGALGGNPTTSPRYPDLVAVAQDCAQRTTGAANFANGIAAGARTQLSTEALTCLRDAWAALSAEDHAAIAQSGLTPDDPSPTAQTTIDRILERCNIDRAQLAPTGP